MAFLFKSKKNQQSQQSAALPPATRNVHTSEGAPSTGSPTMANGGVKGDATTSQTPTPSGSFSNSLHSATSPTSPDAVRPRQRAESESQVGICFVTHSSFFHEDRALISITDAKTSATTQRYPPSKPQFIPLPMVATPFELLFPPNEPVSSLWSSNQFGGIQGRRHIYDGRPD